MKLKMKMIKEFDIIFIFDYYYQEVNIFAKVEMMIMNILYWNIFRYIFERLNLVWKEISDLFIMRLKKLCIMKHLKDYKNRIAAMGIRDIMKLQRKLEAWNDEAAKENEELKNENDIEIEIDLMIEVKDDENRWLN